MVHTFVNPVVNPDAKLDVSLFDETDPIRLWSDHSEPGVEIVIRAVYQQVLGNAHVMESERLTVANYRFVEICVQRILGRNVYGDREKLAWSMHLTAAYPGT